MDENSQHIPTTIAPIHRDAPIGKVAPIADFGLLQKAEPSAPQRPGFQPFTARDYETLHGLVFRDYYPGYKPNVKEIPNGDGKVDAAKRFAHVAPKYLTDPSCPRELAAKLAPFYFRAFSIAYAAALEAQIPTAFLPDVRYGALRVLDYPPGADSAPHQDFDLFTLLLFRDQPTHFLAADHEAQSSGKSSGFALDMIRDHYNHGAHLGQLGETIGLGPATMHEVTKASVAQHSIVYFAIPDHDATVSNHYGEAPPADGSRITVRDWLNERMARSRTEFKKYE